MCTEAGLRRAHLLAVSGHRAAIEHRLPTARGGHALPALVLFALLPVVVEPLHAFGGHRAGGGAAQPCQAAGELGSHFSKVLGGVHLPLQLFAGGYNVAHARSVIQRQIF